MKSIGNLCGVSLDLFVESFGRHAIERRKITIEKNILMSEEQNGFRNCIDAQRRTCIDRQCHHEAYESHLLHCQPAMMANQSRNTLWSHRYGGLTSIGDQKSECADAALKGFIEVHADGEVDQTGSGRAGFVIEEQDAVRDQFVIDLELLSTGKWPAASATAARDEDAHLNVIYRTTLAWANSIDNESTIHADAIHNAQRAWLVYRDAFVRFAAAASPRTSRDAVLARLTGLRNVQLDRMPV